MDIDQGARAVQLIFDLQQIKHIFNAIMLIVHSLKANLYADLQ